MIRINIKDRSGNSLNSKSNANSYRAGPLKSSNDRKRTQSTRVEVVKDSFNSPIKNPRSKKHLSSILDYVADSHIAFVPWKLAHSRGRLCIEGTTSNLINYSGQIQVAFPEPRIEHGASMLQSQKGEPSDLNSTRTKHQQHQQDSVLPGIVRNLSSENEVNLASSQIRDKSIESGAVCEHQLISLDQLTGKEGILTYRIKKRSDGSQNKDILSTQLLGDSLLSSPEKKNYQRQIRDRDIHSDNKYSFRQSFADSKIFLSSLHQQQHQHSQSLQSQFHPISISQNLQGTNLNNSNVYHPNLLTVGISKIAQLQQQQQQQQQGENQQRGHNNNNSRLYGNNKSMMQQQQQQLGNGIFCDSQLSNSAQLSGAAATACQSGHVSSLSNAANNLQKEMRFPPSPLVGSIQSGNNALLHPLFQQAQRSLGEQNNVTGSVMNGFSNAEDKHRILKKILTHFNGKAQMLERKQFMNIFGLEIKQIPSQPDQIRSPQQRGSSIPPPQGIAGRRFTRNNETIGSNISVNRLHSLIKTKNSVHYPGSNLENSKNFGDSKSNNGSESQTTEDVISKNQSSFSEEEQSQELNNGVAQQVTTPRKTGSESEKNPSSQSQSQQKGGSDKKSATINFSASGVKKQQKLVGANQNFKFALSDYNQQKDEIFAKKFNSYKDFIFKLNISNNQFVELAPAEGPLYKLCIGRGNNSKLIRNCFKNRWWWQVVEFEENKLECNFIWTQCKVNEYFEKQENVEPVSNALVVSIVEEYPSRSKVVFEELLSNANKAAAITTNGTAENHGVNAASSPEKKGKGSAQTSNQNAASDLSKQGVVPINKQPNLFPQPADHNSKIFSQDDLQLYQKYMSHPVGQKDYSIQNWDDLSFRLKNIKKQGIENAVKVIPFSQPRMTHNHLQFNFHLGNKKALFYNMRQYYQLTQDDVFNYLPLTFHLTKGTEDKEYRHFLKRFREIEKNQEEQSSAQKSGKKPKNVWIIKPGEITNRGNGIQVCDSLVDIKRILCSKEKHSNGKEKTYIVQKYIDRPFLYNRRKFDIRAYMLITCNNGMIRAFWYQEGYIRTSGREFDLTDVSDVFIHLTNDAIQKDCEEYNKYEPGNKLSYFEFQRYLDINYAECKYNFFSTIIPKMKAIATDSVRATFLKLDPDRKLNNFEIFGLDFMIDEQFNPCLIEINTNPAIETTCPICLRVIPSMVENALRVALDPIFPPPLNWPGQKKHQVPDSPTEHNRFEIIFDEVVDGPSIIHLYKNQSNCLEGMNDLDEDEEIDDEKSDKDQNENNEIEYD